MLYVRSVQPTEVRGLHSVTPGLREGPQPQHSCGMETFFKRKIQQIPLANSFRQNKNHTLCYVEDIYAATLAL